MFAHPQTVKSSNIYRREFQECAPPTRLTFSYDRRHLRRLDRSLTDTLFHGVLEYLLYPTVGSFLIAHAIETVYFSFRRPKIVQTSPTGWTRSKQFQLGLARKVPQSAPPGLKSAVSQPKPQNQAWFPCGTLISSNSPS